ncbi:SWIM zinc finger protein [Colletotrichum eremochloae]|nr:SWIM zinc finger protein [Colletotrichum eremochloae]
MPTTTRAQAHRQSLGDVASDSSSSEPETDSDSSLIDDDDPSVVLSPSRLIYRIDKLSADSRLRVREAFRDPPRLSLQYCRLRDDVYAFQMTEMVPRSIRIGAPGSPFTTPRCSCREQQQKNSAPCKHLLWLLDQLVKQTLYNHDPTSPLTMTTEGYPEEIGDPFSTISDFHLDVLAESLRCDVVTPDSRGEGSEDSGSDPDSDGDMEEHLNPHRVQEVRELLSTIAAYPPEDQRPDLYSDPPHTGKKCVKRHDLEGTIFRMLIDNNEFFHYFLSQMRSTDPVNDPFRKLARRVDRVLRELDTWASSSPSSSSSSLSLPVAGASAEGPPDVAWAARHITGVVGLIRTAILKRDRPLEPWERTSAARALVHILAAVVERNRDFVGPGGAAMVAASSRRDRNLYLRLVGDRDQNFVLDVLNLLPPDAAAQFLHSLEDILDRLGINGAPASYIEKFRSLISRLRRAGGGFGDGSPSSTGAGSKRQGQGHGYGRGSKRIK